MRTLIALVALAASSVATAAQVITTAHRKVSWGWGCGGNCAVNMSGESDTTLGNGSKGARIEDRGSLTRKLSDPRGMMISTTRWRYAFHGTSTAGAARREYELRTDSSECTRTEETMDAGKTTTRKQTACPGPPKRWKLVCERGEVQVKEHTRLAWMCSPTEPMDAFGTEFPWVFGIDGPITTVISGEPEPHISYE